MATWDEVRALASALPEAEETASRDGLPAWSVRGKGFAWERPLRKSDLAALGEAAPTGAILCARVPMVEKEALLASEPDVFFTTPHFNGYPAVLVRLEVIDATALEELLVEAWVTQAPRRLSRTYLDSRSQ
ncbi:MmcQ/YjbR family DNA-binding protein [Luedemannella flava]|uniref:MmcQ/YjbR family DNA-binding protein n=1 Tax=Luedemannella flava TaxID=349316 RepID=A0ABN2M3Y6_9ACTN